MVWLWEHAEKIGTLLTAASAIAALVYAHWAIADGRRAERQANAHELWRDYLRLAFAHPELADPSLRLVDFDYEALTIDGSAAQFQRYEWFTGTLLDACVEIFDFMPSKEWRTSLRSQLRLHRDYLRSAHFLNSDYPLQYNPKFRAFVAEAVAGPEPSVEIAKRPSKRKARANA